MFLLEDHLFTNHSYDERPGIARSLVIAMIIAMTSDLALPEKPGMPGFARHSYDRKCLGNYLSQ